jgi:trehalose-phosphatase
MKFKNQLALTRWAQNASRLWLFLDYDGTLAEFAPSPDDIEPRPRVVGVITRLALRPNMCVTLISGRKLQDIRLLVPVPGIFWAGTYGIELVTPSGKTINRAEYGNIRPILETIKPQWETIIQGHYGFFLEDKGWALALHARFAPDDEASQVIAQADAVANKESPVDHFKIYRGQKFLEIAPSHANKKETVEYLINRYPLPGAQYLYVGDDDRDEEAFTFIHAQAGVAIKITKPLQGEKSTEADFRFKSPKRLLIWLDKLIDPTTVRGG